MNNLPSRWPGEVVSYDGASRTCRVSITGITEGSTDLPIAVFENPLGDRPGDTEIRILPGDLVWLSFECGDPRFPIITGYRTPRVGNPVDWRRWRHANIELTADGEMILNASSLKLNVAGEFSVAAGTEVHTADLIRLTAAIETTGSLKNNGANAGGDHVHGGILRGGSDSDGPH